MFDFKIIVYKTFEYILLRNKIIWFIFNYYEEINRKKKFFFKKYVVSKFLNLRSI